MNALPEPFATMLPLLHEASVGGPSTPRLMLLADVMNVVENRPELWAELVDFFTWEGRGGRHKNSLQLTTRLLLEAVEIDVEVTPAFVNQTGETK